MTDGDRTMRSRPLTAFHVMPLMPCREGMVFKGRTDQ